MSFSVLSSTASQAALIRRLLRSRIILDHSLATTEAIETIQARQPAKSLGAVSLLMPECCSPRCGRGAEPAGLRFIAVPRQSCRTTAVGSASAWSERLATRAHDLSPRLSSTRLVDRTRPRREQRRRRQATGSRTALISPIAFAEGKIVLSARYRVVSPLGKSVTIVVRQGQRVSTGRANT
jgi:hypothetical protein